MKQAHLPIEKISETDLLNHPGTSFWLRTAIHDISNRDLVDYLKDVELLQSILEDRLKAQQQNLSSQWIEEQNLV